MRKYFKIYHVVRFEIGSKPDGYHTKMLYRTELRPFNHHTDSFDTYEECVKHIKNYGTKGETYTIQQEMYISYF